ncbi:MAG: hypothetical protein R2874_12955 [Desulfobacterales bacterium]
MKPSALCTCGPAKLFDQLNYSNIVTRYGDGTNGWKDESPFDAIMVTAGAPDIPAPLVSQLDVGGRMVLPVGGRLTQDMVKLYRDEDGIPDHPGRMPVCEAGGGLWVG